MRDSDKLDRLRIVGVRFLWERSRTVERATAVAPEGAASSAQGHTGRPSVDPVAPVQSDLDAPPLSPESERAVPSPAPRKILSKANLIRSWQSSRDSTTKAARPGVDRITAHQFAANLDRNISRLAQDLGQGVYHFSKLRPFLIPKANGSKERVICVPTVGDRLVQRAICRYLEESGKFPCEMESHLGSSRAGGAAGH